MADEQTYRLFVAIETPREVKTALRTMQETLRASLSKNSMRWTNIEQLHLTLRFLGNVRAARVEELTHALADACVNVAPIHLRAEGVGFFPSHKSPRVIWAGLVGETERLTTLARRVQEATEPFTTEPLEREFRPHLTLGRCKTIRRAEARILAGLARQARAAIFGSWTANGIILFRSEASAGAHRHLELANLPLQNNV